MRKLKFGLAIVAMSFGCNFFGQGQVKYEVVENTPEKKRFFADIYLWGVQMNGIRESLTNKESSGESFGYMCVPMAFEYIHNQKISAFYKGHPFVYLDFSEPSGFGNIQTENEYKKSSYWEIGGSFIFKSLLKDGSNRIDLSSKQIDRKTVQTSYIMVPGKKQVYHKLKTSFYNKGKSITASKHSTLDGNFVKTDSLEFGDYELWGVDRPDGLTHMNTRGITIGYELMTVHHLFVNLAPGTTTSYGRYRKRTGYNTLYADAIIAPSKIDPFIYKGNSYGVTEGFETRSVGWRAGWKMSYPMSKYVNIGANIEGGKAPGLKTEKMFFYLGAGFTVYI